MYCPLECPTRVVQMSKSGLSVCLIYTVSCQREMVKELTTWDVEFKNKASAEALANVWWGRA